MSESPQAQEQQGAQKPPRKWTKGRKKGGGATGAYAIEVAKRRASVLDLRAKGWNFKEIAEELNCSATTAFNDAEKALAEIKSPHGPRLKQLQMTRYERLLKVVWEKVEKGELGAVDRAVNILRRIDRLGNLDKVDGAIQVNIVQLLQEAGAQSISIRGVRPGVELPPIGEPLPMLTGDVLDAEYEVETPDPSDA